MSRSPMRRRRQNIGWTTVERHRMRRFGLTIRRVLTILALLELSCMLCGCVEEEPMAYLSSCRYNLHRFAQLLEDARASGVLRPLPGRAFLTQLAARMDDYDALHIFACAGDPLAPTQIKPTEPYCSVFGPDQATAERWIRRELGNDVIIVCDGFGASGVRVTHKHLGSVVALWSSGRVEIIAVADIVGYGSPEFRVGPECVDERFRHLEW